MSENENSLGEEPIARTETGLPIYPREETDEELRNRIIQERFDAKNEQVTKPKPISRTKKKARRYTPQDQIARMQLANIRAGRR